MLGEYNYEVTYIPGKLNVRADDLSRLNIKADYLSRLNVKADYLSRLNVKADYLSRLKRAETNGKGMYTCDDNIYSFIQGDTCLEQLRSEQEVDPIILIGENKEGENGQLKRIIKQLRIERDVLTKTGQAIIPRSLQLYVINEIHKDGDLANHFGIDKTYNLLKKRFYRPNMYRSLKNYIAECITCNKCKADQSNKAPLFPIIVPECPMEFLPIDIAHMETDHEGYRHILIMGDMFSKYIEAVPMKDQTPETTLCGNHGLPNTDVLYTFYRIKAET